MQVTHSTRDVWGPPGSKRAQSQGAQTRKSTKSKTSKSRFENAMVGANPRSHQREGGGQSSAEGSVTSLVDNKVISDFHLF